MKWEFQSGFLDRDRATGSSIILHATCLLVHVTSLGNEWKQIRDVRRKTS